MKNKISFYLNTVTGWLDTTVHMIVSFLINPIIVNKLGSYNFGVWQILIQLIGYMTAADMQPGTTLKWYVAKNRHLKDYKDFSSVFSSSLFVTILSIPIYILLALIISYLLPKITQTENKSLDIINITFFILIFSFIINQFVFLSKSLFVGMNLSYKRIGIQAFSSIVVGGLSYLFLNINLGIIGLAIASISGVLISLLIYYFLTKKIFFWLKISRVTFNNLLIFIKLNSQYLLLKISNLLNESFDIIILGYFLSPVKVASYTLTYFSGKAIIKFIQEFTTAASPGLSKSKSTNINEFLKNRDSFININWLAIGLTVPIIILINEAFVSLWIGPDSYLGDYENMLISLILILKLTRDAELSIIAMSLEVKKIALINLSLGLLSIVISFILIPSIGVLGLLLAIIVSLIISNLIYFNKTERLIKSYYSFYHNKSFKLTIIWTLLAFLMSLKIDIPQTWLYLISISFLFSSLIFLSYWTLLINKKKQKILMNKLINKFKNE